LSTTINNLAREQFDARLKRLQKATAELNQQTPRFGWVKAIRTALGMSERAFAKRLGVTHGSVQELERNERSGKVTLDTLRRAARALDADFVYAIVPRKPLRETIAARARALAAERFGPISRSMTMEDQGLTKEQTERRIAALAEKLEAKPSDLWR
jgi:predicted DNA-binding mobile mystery protein A